MEEIERLINQAEQDAVQASDEAMRLMVEFGDDTLLMGFVGTANQLKLDVSNFRAGLHSIRRQAQSPERNASMQLLMVEARDLGSRASKIKETVLEISRND